MERDARRPLGWKHLFYVVGLSVYCAAAILLPVGYLCKSFDHIFRETDPSTWHIFVTTVLMGILGSAMRGMSRLFNDVGQGKYDPKWNLSILMRPLEGAGIALVSYLAITAGIIVLERKQPTPSAAGYLFVGILSGMFSHRAADGLFTRFAAFMSSKRKRKP